MGYMRSSLSVKNQITLPRVVRETLKINAKDTIEYIIEEDKVYIKKVAEENICPICINGTSVNNYNCPICNGVGSFNEKVSTPLLISKLNLFLIQSEVYEIEIKKDDLIGYIIQVNTEDDFIKAIVSRVQFEILRASLVKKKTLSDEEKEYIKEKTNLKNSGLRSLLNLF